MTVMSELFRRGSDSRADASQVELVSKPGRSWWGSRDAKPTQRDLDITTSQSTLQSVLSLLARNVSTNPWSWYLSDKPGAIPTPEDEKTPITSEQSLPVKLWNQPNPVLSGNRCRRVVQWHYDAVGEGWMVVEKNPAGLPQAFWPVMPYRMTPAIADDGKRVIGYSYRSPDGEDIPLGVDEVLRIWDPHPMNPYRGVGPVPALMLPLGISLSSLQWMQVFYQNDATPGGMIMLNQDEVMEEGDYRKLVARHNFHHRGISRAHRVGILEVGSYQQFNVNLKELQFTEMHQLNRDIVLEAYQVHKHMLGASDDVNRAASLAADATFGKRVLKPRLNEWKDLANGDYLRMFGPLPRPIEACYENPVPEDQESENAELTAKTSAAATLAGTGVWDPDDILTTCELPPMRRANGTATVPATPGT